MAVCPDRYTAAHVDDYQVELLIFTPHVTGITVSYGLVIECMEYGHPWQSGQARDAGHVIQLVYDDGVGDECHASVYGSCYVVSQDCAKVAGMFACGMFQFVDHLLIDSIYAALEGRQQPATPDDCPEVI